MFKSREGSEEKPKKQATKPGWRPSSRLNSIKAKKGYTARWVENKPERLAKMREEGWEMMKPEDNEGTQITSYDVNDGKALHNGIRQKELIAMMLPDSLKEDREEYHRQENRDAVKNILRDTDGHLAETGARSYTPKGLEGRIVIE